MLHDQLAYCRRRIDEEEQRARHATDPAVRDRHLRAASVYRDQLAELEHGIAGAGHRG